MWGNVCQGNNEQSGYIYTKWLQMHILEVKTEVETDMNTKQVV